MVIKNPLADKPGKPTILQENCHRTHRKIIPGGRIIKKWQHTQVKVNFDLDVHELTSRTLAKRLRTLANRPKTLANETLAKRLVGETAGYQPDRYPTARQKISQPDSYSGFFRGVVLQQLQSKLPVSELLSEFFP